MEINKKELKKDILKLAFDLEKQYPELDFKHHCYLRIAYDNCVQDKWNNVIKASFLNNCSNDQLNITRSLLIIYKNNLDYLIQHNIISLNYRK